MSLTADFYGKKKAPIPPHMMPREVAVQPLTREELGLHPIVQETAVRWHEMANELDRLRRDFAQAINDLEIERRANDELRRSVDHERALKESAQRSLIELSHHAKSIFGHANEALSCANAVLGPREEKMMAVEEGLKTIVRQVQTEAEAA